MASVKPYLTSDSLVESVKLRMMFPLSQETFTYSDILKIANEEMMINAVPQVKQAHEEYFVFPVIVPLVNGIAKYEIPYRSLGMALRDLFYSDTSGNYTKMTRTAPEDKAFFQNSSGNNLATDTYYIEGNNIVLSSQIVSGATGSIIFSIYLRPNFLVRDDRACTIQNYVKYITVADNSAISVGDQIIIVTGNQTQSPTSVTLTATSGSPTDGEFLIGGTAAITAANINTALTNAGVSGFSTSVSTNNVILSYTDITTTFFTGNTTAFAIDLDTTSIKFDQLPSTYREPDTDVTSDLYLQGGLVDFLQTNAGHCTYAYDVEILEIMSGNIAKFSTTSLQGYMNNNTGGTLAFFPIKVGDYICPQNECIIPQIPSELHYALAERAASFILQAIGDQEGYMRSEKRIQQMNEAQASLIDSRITGSVPKVFNPNSLLRSGKRYRRGRW